MKKVYSLLLLSVFFLACGSSKKIPASNTTIASPTGSTSSWPATSPKTTSPTPVSDNMASINGRWKFESSSEKDFSKMGENALPQLNFNETDRKVSGSTGCNQLNGFFFTSGNQFNFSPLAIDKKGCTDATVEKYIKVFFKAVGFYKTDGNKIYFYNKPDKSKYVVFIKK